MAEKRGQYKEKNIDRNLIALHEDCETLLVGQ